MPDRPDDATAVDPTDREAVRSHLERFAGAGALRERSDGALVADFRGVTHVTISADGRIETGMPLHEFAGAPDQLVFDHDNGEIHVEIGDGVAYTFRRP